MTQPLYAIELLDQHGQPSGVGFSPGSERHARVDKVERFRYPDFARTLAWKAGLTEYEDYELAIVGEGDE